MRFYLPTGLVLALLVLGQLRGQEPVVQASVLAETSLIAQVADLQARLAALESESRASAALAGSDHYYCDPDPCSIGDCGCCNSGCRWVGGAGVYLFKPHWFGGNPAFIIRDTATDQREFVSFDQSYNTAPLAWFGYVGPCGLGAQVRWFGFHEQDHVAAVAAPDTIFELPLGDEPINPVTNGRFDSNLKLNVWDVECTQLWQCDCWSLTGSAGVRYAQVVTEYDVFLQNVAQVFTTQTRQNFDGIGPTVSLLARRPIGCWGCGLFGAARGSVLAGKNEFQQAGDFTSHASDWEPLTIGEIEVGADTRHFLGRSEWIGEAGFVGQTWNGLGASSQLDQLGNGGTDGFVLYGLRASIGVAY